MATNGKISVTKCESIQELVEQMHDKIRNRAYDIFLVDGSQVGRELDHWLKAERELLWRASVEVKEKGEVYEAMVAVPGVDPKNLKISVTSKSILITAETAHQHKEETNGLLLCDFASGRLFRGIEFPKEISPDSVKVDLKNGLLQVRAEIAKAAKPKKARAQGA